MADSRLRLPTLSNAGQLRIMQLVKQGMSIDDALKHAEQQERLEQSKKPEELEAGVLIRNQFSQFSQAFLAAHDQLSILNLILTPCNSLV
jgi:hypothetical protein